MKMSLKSVPKSIRVLLMARRDLSKSSRQTKRSSISFEESTGGEVGILSYEPVSMSWTKHFSKCFLCSLRTCRFFLMAWILSQNSCIELTWAFSRMTWMVLKYVFHQESFGGGGVLSELWTALRRILRNLTMWCW